jgi:DNA repair protein RecO (recombination protein O)
MMMVSKTSLGNQTAFVLHHFPYKNNSLIIYFFLPGQGKVSAIARGIRQSKKNEMSSIQPFQELKVSLQGKSDLLFLKNVDIVSQVWNLQGKSLYCAYYLNELLLRLLPAYTDCRDIFYLYAESLGLLLHPEHTESVVRVSETITSTDNNISLEKPLRYFELKLLEFLGYGLNLVIDVDRGETVLADKRYYYDINAGPSLNQHSAARLIPVNGQTLINMSRLQFNDKQTLQQSKQLLKCALSTHLGSKSLKSREMFRQLYC